MDDVPDNNADEHGKGVAEQDAPQAVRTRFRRVAHQAGSGGDAGEKNQSFFSARGEKSGDEGNGNSDNGALNENFAGMERCPKLMHKFVHRTPLFTGYMV